MTKIARYGVVVVLLFCGALTSRAQVTTGTISGTVTDSTGAVLPGTNIVIQNEDTGISRTVTTDSAGRYLAPSLTLGNYRVTATLQGFQSEVRTGIVLTVGREAVVDLKLTVGAVTQSVEVTGEAPLLETTTATTGSLVNQQTIVDLPLNGRDLTQLVLTNPGVTQATNGSVGSAFNGWGKKLSISGARSEDSELLLDGSYIVDMNHHIPAGPDGAILGVETVREFQVLTNSFGAQYGRTMGGVINAVSKSGTNQFHGDLFEFLRNSALDARNFFDRQYAPAPTPVSPLRQNQFGATAGGPIKKDKLFIFGAYEGMRLRHTLTTFSVVPDANARLGILPTGNVTPSAKSAPFLALYPLPTPGARNFGDGTAQYVFQAPQPTSDDFGQARIDYQISGSDSMFGRFTASDSVQSLISGGFPGYVQIPSMTTRLLTLSETHIFSPRMLLATHFSFNRVIPLDGGSLPAVPSFQQSVPGQGPPSLAPGSGITAIGGGYGNPTEYFVTNRFNEQGDISLTLGAHAVQFGGMVERLRFNQDFPNRPWGVWTFANLQAFLAGTPNRWRGTPSINGYDPIADERQNFYALYIQDDWKVTPKLTLNLGVRWEPYSVPTRTNGTDYNLQNVSDTSLTPGPLWQNKSWSNFGPRFGFAWSPFNGGKTAIRGGFGISYLPNDTNVYRNELSRNAVWNPDLNFAVGGTTGVPITFPDGLAQIAAYLGTGAFGQSPSIVSKSFKTPYVMQYSLTVQQQLGASSVVTVGFAGSRGVNQTSFSDYNMPHAYFDGVSLAFPAGSTRINPKFDAIYYTAANANSWYDAGTVSFQRRFSAGLQAAVSFTLAKALSESETAQLAEYSGGGTGPMIYAYQPSVDKSWSGFGVAQTLNANYAYALPFGKGMTGVTGRLASGWQLTGILTVQSGQPFAISRSIPTAQNSINANTAWPNRNLAIPYGQIVTGNPNQYFNPAAYSAPSALELGNAGRNPLFGPGLASWDPGVTKDTKLTERFGLEFRGELFNVLNRANFAKPTGTTLFGATGTPIGSAGLIDHTITNARQIQFGLKLLF